MANKEHLNILKQGPGAWNSWRKNNPSVAPDLNNAFIDTSRLPKNIGKDGVNFWEVCDTQLQGAILNGVNLSGANLIMADLRQCELREADLHGANLRGANLSDADMSSANLSGADLGDAIMVSSRLNFANLIWSHFRNTQLNGSDWSMAIIGWTILGDLDLSSVNGLEKVQHGGPSSIGVDTLYRSKGMISETFLRHAGVPDNFFLHVYPLVSRGEDFYSCFISYSSKDESFVHSLYSDLRNNGVPCWFAPNDLKIGDKLRHSIDESIKRYDKLLLVISKNSIKSQYVEQEVETALEKERKTKKGILVPITIDNAVMNVESGWAALIRKTHNIGNFREWKVSGYYKEALVRLTSALKKEERL